MTFNCQLENCCNTCTVLKLECESLRRQLEKVSSQYQNMTNVTPCDSVEQSTQTSDDIQNASCSVQTDCVKQSVVEIQTETISSPSMSTGIQVANIVSEPVPPCYDMLPYDLHTERPFLHFSASELDQHTQQHYQTTFSNRIVAYYGEVPYQYGNTLHQTIPFEDNSYLQDIPLVTMSPLLPCLPHYYITLIIFLLTFI